MTSQTLRPEGLSDDVGARQRWMWTLAAADADTLDASWQGWQPKPAVQAVRGAPRAGACRGHRAARAGAGRA